MLKGEGVNSSTSWFWPASGGDVLLSSFLQPYTGGPGQDVSCKLNKGILAYLYLGGRLPRDGLLCII